jgi:hypothetical protein
VGAVVVQHQVYFHIGRNCRVDSFQEVEELHRTMPTVAFAENVARGDIEGRKQACDAMSLVVMRAPFQLSGSRGSAG